MITHKRVLRIRIRGRERRVTERKRKRGVEVKGRGGRMEKEIISLKTAH